MSRMEKNPKDYMMCTNAHTAMFIPWNELTSLEKVRKFKNLPYFFTFIILYKHQPEFHYASCPLLQLFFRNILS